MASADARSDPADNTTPFGSPVEPDVATMNAASGSATGTSGRSIASVRASPGRTGATTASPARAAPRRPHSASGGTASTRWFAGPDFAMQVS